MSFQDFFVKFFRQLKIARQIENIDVQILIGNFAMVATNTLDFTSYVIYELSSIATIGNFVALTFKYVSGYNVPLNFYEPSLGLYYLLPGTNNAWGVTYPNSLGLQIQFYNTSSGSIFHLTSPFIISTTSPFYIYPFFTVFGTLVDMFPTNYTVL